MGSKTTSLNSWPKKLFRMCNFCWWWQDQAKNKVYSVNPTYCRFNYQEKKKLAFLKCLAAQGISHGDQLKRSIMLNRSQAPARREDQDRIWTYRLALLVFAPVQNSPVDLPGVPFGQECRLTLAIQKLEHLKKWSGKWGEKQHCQHYQEHTDQLLKQNMNTRRQWFSKQGLCEA